MSEQEATETTDELLRRIDREAAIETLSSPSSHFSSAVVGSVGTLAMLIGAAEAGLWGVGVSQSRFLIIFFASAAVAGGVVAGLVRLMRGGLGR